MILGQLIQTGRRFCECRSEQFVPKSEDEIIVLYYTIHDRFIAISFDVEEVDVTGTIRDWLQENDAVAYLMISRIPHRDQSEFPAPLGRLPMDRVTLTAATSDAFQVESYFLEEIESLNACRLLRTSNSRFDFESCRKNLFDHPAPRASERATNRIKEFPEFSDYAN